MSAARRRVIDSEQIARDMRERFQAKRVQERIELPFDWPSRMQHVGQNLGVAYRSNKWQSNPEAYEDYLHIAESRNDAYCAPNVMVDGRHKPYRCAGKYVDLRRSPFGQHFSVLGEFLEARLRLHSGETVELQLRHAMLGAGVLRWRGGDEPFVFVYTEPSSDDPGGVHMIITGDELDISRDGIVG